jgi:hypothetical protein
MKTAATACGVEAVSAISAKVSGKARGAGYNGQLFGA